MQDNKGPYLGTQDAVRDEETCLGKPRVSAFQRMSPRLERRLGRRYTSLCCHGAGVEGTLVRGKGTAFVPDSCTSPPDRHTPKASYLGVGRT